MTKSKFYKLATDIINNTNMDIVQHYTACLFIDKLWTKIEESQNEENERDINTSSN